jgi:hypothetical protein
MTVTANTVGRALPIVAYSILLTRVLTFEVVGHTNHDDPFFEKECALEH